MDGYRHAGLRARLPRIFVLGRIVARLGIKP
jgi:hypothetical protein